MTEKRFNFEKERINNSFACRILEGNKVLFEVNNWNALSKSNSKEVEDLCNRMNELADFNVKLMEEKDYYKRELQKELVCQAIINRRGEKND